MTDRVIPGINPVLIVDLIRRVDTHDAIELLKQTLNVAWSAGNCEGIKEGYDGANRAIDSAIENYKAKA